MIKRNAVFENLIVLWIAVEKKCTPEVAFRYFDRTINGNKRKAIGLPRFEWKKEDVQDILKFRHQGISYKEIGNYYGVMDQAIKKTIKRYELSN